MNIDLGPWCRRVGVAGFLMALGIGLRIGEYLAGRQFWLDESSLLGNIVNAPTFTVFGPLSSAQVAPPWFLTAERVMARAFGEGRYALRFLPMLAAVASVPLCWAVARRVLPTRRAALIALALFAVSDELIYFGAELKPYGLDVTAALAITAATLALRDRPLTARAASGYASLGAVLVWFSFTSVFVLASAGLVLAGEALTGRRWGRLAGLAGVGAAWVASFLVSWLAARSQLGGHPGLWAFWDFAFMADPAIDPGWAVRRILYLFVSPLDFYGPFDPRLSALPAIGCATLGLVRLSALRPAESLLLLGPPGLALLASRFAIYPFHGRLVLFAVPALILLIAAGADGIGRRCGPRSVGVALLIVLLGHSLFLDLVALTWRDRGQRDWNPHGDRRPAWMVPDLFRPGIEVAPPGRIGPADRKPRSAGTAGPT